MVGHAEVSTIDLATLGPANWDRVCFIGPYQNNESTRRILGFSWDSDHYPSIGGNDGVYVLVFVQASKVVAFTEHPRNMGDFLNIGTSCLPRDSAKVRRKTEANGWIQLVRANEA